MDFINQYLTDSAQLAPGSELFQRLYRVTVGLAAHITNLSQLHYKSIINPIDFNYKDNRLTRDYLLLNHLPELNQLESNLYILLLQCLPDDSIVETSEPSLAEERALHKTVLTGLLYLRQGNIVIDLMLGGKRKSVTLNLDSWQSEATFKALLNQHCGYKIN